MITNIKKSEIDITSTFGVLSVIIVCILILYIFKVVFYNILRIFSDILKIVAAIAIYHYVYRILVDTQPFEKW